MKICWLLVFLVVVVQEAYCGVVGKNGQTLKEVVAENEAGETECGLESQDDIANSEKSDNSPLLYDTNIGHTPHDGNSDGVKHKRCHHSYSRVGASLEPRAGIVGAKAPQAVERRDLQNKFYTKACTTCLSRCEANYNCPVCEKWCSKATNDEQNEVDANTIIGAAQDTATPEEPVMSVRSNFDDEKRKNVYTITTLRAGSIKELFLKVLGVSNPEDVDTVVIWVTTHSNHPPLISRDFTGELDLEGQKAAEAMEKELKSKAQAFHQNGKKFVKEGAEGMDNAIQNILSEVHPKIAGNKGVDNSQMSPRSDMASEILPRYPIESEPVIIPQKMNPGIIEGPPNFRTIDGEIEDLDRLEARQDQVEGGSVSEGEQTLGTQQGSTDRTIAVPYPSSDGNEDLEQKKTQPPDTLLRAGNEPEVESFPLDSKPRPFAANQGRDNKITGENNVGTPLENSVNEKFEILKKKSLTPGMERLKDQMAPGARLREFIDNMKANIVGSKNALPSQKKLLDSSLNKIKSGNSESGDSALSTLGRAHGHGGKGHVKKGHHNRPHTHRSSSQDDNIGLIFKPQDKTEPTTTIPDPGPLIEKLPLPENQTTVPGNYPPTPFGSMLAAPMNPLNSNRFSEQNRADTIVPENTDMRLGTELEENADTDNHDERSSNGHIQGHGHGHHPGHGPVHHQGHGQGHHPGPVHGHGHGHGQGHGHFHRSSELGDPETFSLLEERPIIESDPGFENGMVAEPAPGDPSGENPYPPGVLEPESRTERPIVPVKFNVGARANELIQKLKERQEMRKASLASQGSPLGTSRNDLKGSSKPVEGFSEPFADSGREDSRTVGAPSDVNNFETAKAALGEVNDLSKKLEDIIDTSKPILTKIKTDGGPPNHVADYAEQTLDEIEKPNVGINAPEILGSQPLENSLERTQPSMSLSGRPWRKLNYGNAFINEPKNEMIGEPIDEMLKEPMNEMFEQPSLASANPDGDSETQNLNPRPAETVAESNPDMNTRGHFKSDRNSFSNSMGAIVPAENSADMYSHKKPTDVYFLGNGIKLPMIAAKDKHGVLHLSVDLDKLCSCNNITCPKNHTVLEQAVETILENEPELKEQLEPMDLVSEGNVQEDDGDRPLGMAPPQSLFEDGPPETENPSELEERVQLQPRFWSFEEDAMRHRNQRDTDEERRFIERKNKIAGGFDSMKLQSKVLDKSPSEKGVKSGNKRLQAPMKKFAVTSTYSPQRSEDVHKQQNLLLKSMQLNDGAQVSGEADEQDTKTSLPSGSSTKTMESTTKNSSSEPNYLQNFVNKKLDDIRSKLEIRSEDMKKELSFPEYFFKNLWAAGKEQADKVASTLNRNNPTPILASRLGSFLDKTVAANNEVYENLAPITKPYKFKALENQLKSNLEHIGDTVDSYTKRDDDILKEEVAALNKITENPVVRKEVGIVSNILKFLKELAAEKNKRK